MLFNCQIWSQSGKLYTSDTELSSSLINSIYQDSKGYLWSATEDGLNRYDGSKFIIYRNEKNVSGSLLNNYVKSIFEDANKNLFFGFINGLQLYKHTTDSFVTIPMYNLGNTKTNPHVSCIFQRKNGDILIGTSGYGVFKVNLKKESLTANSIKLSIPSGMIHEIYEDHNQNLWIMTQDKELWKIDKNNKVKQYLFSKEHLTIITSMCEDKNGGLYVGTLNDGLFIYNKATQKFDSFDNSAPLPIKKLYLEKNNKILIGTDGMGLYTYDITKKTMSVTNFTVSNFDFARSKIHIILEDRGGNLWLGLFQKGLLLLPPKESNFKYLGYQSITNNVIGSSCVMSVYKDHKNILWVGTDGDGLYGISEKGKREFHYSLDKNGFGRIAIMSIFEDSNNDLWIGTYLHGMAKLNKSSNKFEFINTLLDHEGKPVESVYSIIESNDKHLWIGTQGAGLFKMNLQTLKAVNLDSFRKGKNKNVPYGNRYINCILASKNNKLYIATYDGLYCWDLKTKTFIEKGGQNHILSEKIIYALNEDKLGNLWIGTSVGLVYLNKECEIIKTFTTEDNLPSNIICGIERDKKDNLWISTNNGISKFNTKTKKFYNFYFNNGLQGNEFSKNASFVDNQNQIIFGGMKGVTYFDPENIKDNGKTTKVYITGLYIQDRSVKQGMKSDGLDIINSALIDAKTVDLGYEDNSFSIEFSSLDFINQQHITYYYSLNSDKWNKLHQGNNTVTFDNLEPGTYNLKIKAELYGKFSEEKSLTITIHPVWYFSFVAKCFYWIVLLVLIVFAKQQLKQRQITKTKLEEHLRNKQINDAKLQFLTNISHDIKSPISLVINPLTKLMNTDQDTIRQQWYQVMYRNSEKILQLINQVMDVRRLDQGQISLNFDTTEVIQSVKDLCLLFEEQIKTKNITLNINYSQPNLYIWADPVYFDRIIQNVLSNAVKFVPQNGKIDIIIEKQQQRSTSNLIITIVDNGIGLNEEETTRIFDRFYQADNSKLQHSEGTGIGLHFTKSIVELHNGSIIAQNNIDDSGCRFIITLPIGEEFITQNFIEENQSIEANIPVISEPAHRDPINNATSRKRILVVDDNDEIREYIYKELSQLFKVSTSANGKEALEDILTKPFDLIISDVKMPVMDGVTLCRKIKKNININHIPVILLTAKSHEHDQLEGLNIGADAYITKPFNIEILKKTALNLIRNREMLKNNYSGNQIQEDKIEKIAMESADEKLIQKIMVFINKNLNDPALNVEMIASEVGISRVHLHRKLKELTSQSSRDLIRNIRLKQAGELLASKHTNIAEVAYLVGFSNTSKFSTSFKEFYGVSPKAYMEEQHKKNANNSSSTES